MKYKFLEKAVLDEKIINFEEANVSIATNAFQFGTNAWGGMRVNIVKEGGKKYAVLFRLDEHVKRFVDSSKMLFQEGKPVTKEYIKNQIISFIKANKKVKSDFYIRPIIYASDLGPMPSFAGEKKLCIYGAEMGDYLENDGIAVCVSSFRRQEDTMIPTRGKIGGSYYISCAAKSEAINRGFDDSIMLNMAGKVSEGSAMNIFMVRNNCLITPPSTDNILEGITRSSVIEIAKSLGIEVLERSIDLSELMFKADEVFFTGTAAKLTPCRKIEHIELMGESPIFEVIKNKYEDVMKGSDSDFSDWTSKIEMV